MVSLGDDLAKLGPQPDDSADDLDARRFGAAVPGWPRNPSAEGFFAPSRCRIPPRRDFGYDDAPSSRLEVATHVMRVRSERLESLASPAFVAALALLVVNDVALKPLFHNAVTGKLSDFACLFSLSLFLAALWPRHARVHGENDAQLQKSTFSSNA